MDITDNRSSHGRGREDTYVKKGRNAKIRNKPHMSALMPAGLNRSHSGASHLTGMVRVEDMAPWVYTS